jgi:hypothetical protein
VKQLFVFNFNIAVDLGDLICVSCEVVAQKLSQGSSLEGIGSGECPEQEVPVALLQDFSVEDHRYFSR